MHVKPNTVLFAAPDDTEMQEAARQYVKDFGLSKDDVKLVIRTTAVMEGKLRKTEPVLCVVAKRDIPCLRPTSSSRSD